jgi:hypothetical protein
MHSVLSSATDLLAPWARFYSDSKVVSTSVTFAHIGGLLLGGGCAVAGDRMTMRFESIEVICQDTHLDELTALHRPVLIGLGITLVSGFLLLGADLSTYLVSVVFWAKMVIVATLLLNGIQLQRAERALLRDPARPAHRWKRLRQAAKVSLLLWFSATLLGTALLAI